MTAPTKLVEPLKIVGARKWPSVPTPRANPEILVEKNGGEVLADTSKNPNKADVPARFLLCDRPFKSLKANDFNVPAKSKSK